jgi:molybdate transport system substrate-binding protein
MVKFTRRRFAIIICAAIGTAAIGTGAMIAPVEAQPGGPIVFAAASLKTALDDINAAWQREQGKRATISYAASSALAKQIEGGAPADVFISADLDWMDYLAQRQLVRNDTRSNLLGNRLVLIAPKGSSTRTAIRPGFPLAEMLGDGHLAMANTAAVPAGKYGKAALQNLGVWDRVSAKIAQAENARAALLLVARGEAPLGIVYQTDAAADPDVKILDYFPEDSHPPIIYPVAVLAKSQNADAADFVAYLRSPAAKALFRKQGFTSID